MLQAPSNEGIRSWLMERRPLGIEEPIEITDIDPKAWSGHFNFLVKAGGERFVLRFKGPEWGEAEKGIRAECDILRAVEPYGVGPRVFGITDDFFGENALFMEFLDGKPLNALAPEKQRNYFPAVAELAARINRIPYQDFEFALPTIYGTYREHAATWRERLGVIRSRPGLEAWAERIDALLPSAEAALSRFEPALERVLRERGPAFIFASAHIGHCFVTPNGLRFINWEKTGIGDPCFTLAVFLASIRDRADFPAVQEEMIRQYLAANPMPGFAELLANRLVEREVSNLIWVLWNYARSGDSRPADEAVDAERRYGRALDALGLGA